MTLAFGGIDPYHHQEYALIDWEGYIANIDIPYYDFDTGAVKAPEKSTFYGFDGMCLPNKNKLSNLNYPMSINYASSIASLTYVTCAPVSSTLATAGQFTIYAQVVIVGFYLLYRKISIEGVGVLTKQETYIDLWENDKVVLEG